MQLKHLYTPVLKGKQNDLKALAKVTAESRAIIKPLIELIPVPDNIKINVHIDKFALDIVKHYPDGPIFVDPYGLLPGEYVGGVLGPIRTFQALKKLGRTLTPTYGLDRDPAVWADLPKIIASFNAGFCFRIDIDDLDERSEDTWAEIIERSADLGLKPSNVDLIIDLRDIGREEYIFENYKDIILDFLALKPYDSKYRSIALIGSSIPKTVVKIKKDGVGEITRNELRLWMHLRSDLDQNIELIFGDYGIVNPDFSATGPNKNANAKIRYTVGAKTVIFRGHKLYDPSDFPQYHELSDRVRKSGFYRGEKFSVGDKIIEECASFQRGTGNLGTWVQADMNHHIEYTARQLQTLTVTVSDTTSTEELDELIEVEII